MVTTLRINNGKAKVLFDTGTTGTILLSNGFVQTNRIQMETLQPPVNIRLATKESKTVAKDQVTCTVEISPQIRVKTRFKVVPIKEYQAIMGMPLLQQHEVKLDTANGTAISGKHRDYTIRCNEAQSVAILVTAAAGTNEETVTPPDFTKEFPNVVAEKESEGLPPLQKKATTRYKLLKANEGNLRKDMLRLSLVTKGNTMPKRLCTELVVALLCCYMRSERILRMVCLVLQLCEPRSNERA
jgi:hypothetical protein